MASCDRCVVDNPPVPRHFSPIPNGEPNLKLISTACFVALLAVAPILARGESAASAPASKPAAAEVTPVNRGSLPMKFDAAGYFEPVDPVEVRLRFKAYAGDLTI